jgi:hypothetical protein
MNKAYLLLLVELVACRNSKTAGCVPLDLLEEKVNRWIDSMI